MGEGVDVEGPGGLLRHDGREGVHADRDAGGTYLPHVSVRHKVLCVSGGGSLAALEADDVPHAPCLGHSESDVRVVSGHSL
ncbi:hypothetical protein ACWD3J_44400 [Streptomyces sp. NPDC002755]